MEENCDDCDLCASTHWKELIKNFPIEFEFTKANPSGLLLQLKPGSTFDGQCVKKVLQRLSKFTQQSYVALYNSKSHYLLITIRG